jgi:hypothetical protein
VIPKIAFCRDPQKTRSHVFRDTVRQIMFFSSWTGERAFSGVFLGADHESGVILSVQPRKPRLFRHVHFRENCHFLKKLPSFHQNRHG